MLFIILKSRLHSGYRFCSMCMCVQNLLLLRHHHEAESLHAVQKMDWEWKLKECGQCDYKSTPIIDEVHLPMVQVNDEFELLPPQRLRPSWGDAEKHVASSVMTASSGVASTLSWHLSGGAGDHAGSEGAAHCQASLCHLSSTGTGSASPQPCQGHGESHAAKLGLSFNTRRDVSVSYLAILPARSTAENERQENRALRKKWCSVRFTPVRDMCRPYPCCQDTNFICPSTSLWPASQCSVLGEEGG